MLFRSVSKPDASHDLSYSSITFFNICVHVNNSLFPSYILNRIIKIP